MKRFHRSPHGLFRGAFGGGFGGPRGFGGRGGMRTGRKLGAADLQLVILALLGERPQHGYELIKTLEERSGGFYVPSPGVIYPALTYLEETGLAVVAADGAKKLYSLSDDGKAHLAQNRDRAGTILAEMAKIGARMGKVREAFAGEGEAEDEHPRAGVRAARHALRAALHGKRGCSAEEAARIAAILTKAAEEIAG